jgi:hypothetical protein
MGKPKDTDKDGVIDSQDQWPNDPSLPVKSDVAGILGAISNLNLNLNPSIPTTLNNANTREDRVPVDSSLQSNVVSPVASPTPTGSANSTIKNVKQYNTQQVVGLAESAFKAAIGRTATDKELAALRDHINTEEKRNPSISGSSASSSTTTSGGIDESQMAKTFAESNPEYAGYQKATTYFDSMMSALRGTAGGGI